MVLATEYFRENNIRFDVVLDEGGAITQGAGLVKKGKTDSLTEFCIQ